MDNSITRLLSEANEKNQPKRPLSLINVSPQIPVVLTDNDTHNTQVTIDGVPGRTYVGSQTLLYKRISLPEALADLQLRNTVPFTTQMVLDMVNRQMGLFLVEDDLEPFTPPELALNETKTLLLVSRADSFGFVGQVEISLMYGRTLLESVIGIRLLSLFSHPTDPNLGKQSGRMVTWGIDFTSLRDSMMPHPLTKTYTDWSTFQSACLYLQIPAWTKGYIADHSTADIPDSNPAFDRVIIQPLVNSAYIIGPLYFHYNLLDEV